MRSRIRSSPRRFAACLRLATYVACSAARSAPAGTTPAIRCRLEQRFRGHPERALEGAAEGPLAAPAGRCGAARSAPAGTPPAIGCRLEQPFRDDLERAIEVVAEALLAAGQAG